MIACVIQGIASGSSYEDCVEIAVIDQQEIDTRQPYILEGRIAYFYPLSHTVREIYGSGGIEYSLEADFQMKNIKNLYAWADVSYFQKSGHTSAMHTSTKLQLVSTGFGLKTILFGENYCVYVGLGALPSYLNIHDDSPYVKQVTRKWSWGGVAKSGCNIRIYQWLWIDLFLDYAFVTFSFSDTSKNKVYSHTANLNHLSIGGGPSFQF